MAQPSHPVQPPGTVQLRTVLNTHDFSHWQTSVSHLLGEHTSELVNSRAEQADLGFHAHLRAGRIADIAVVAIEGVGRTRLDRHQRADAFVLWLPLSGWVRETVNGQVLLAEPGMALLCRPGLHLIGESSARLRGLSLVLPAQRLGAMGFGTMPAPSPLPVLIGSGPEARAVIAQAHQLAAQVCHPATLNEAGLAEQQVQRLCESLLHWEVASSGSASAVHPPSRSAAIVAEVEAWMGAHLSEPLRIADLAHQLALTPRSLQLAFQHECGCSPMQRLKRLRLRALHEQLERGDNGAVPLEELLGSLGLPRYGRTRSEFRRWCGSSPSEHRRDALGRQSS